MLTRLSATLLAVAILPVQVDLPVPQQIEGYATLGVVLGAFLGVIEFVKWWGMRRAERNGNGLPKCASMVQRLEGLAEDRRQETKAMVSCLNRFETTLGKIDASLDALMAGQAAIRLQHEHHRERMHDAFKSMHVELDRIEKLIA